MAWIVISAKTSIILISVWVVWYIILKATSLVISFYWCEWNVQVDALFLRSYISNTYLMSVIKWDEDSCKEEDLAMMKAGNWCDY